MTRSKMIACVAILFSIVMSGCGGEEDETLGECPTNAMSQELMGRNVVKTRCQICHASTLTGAARNAAPVGNDFDVLDVVRTSDKELYEEIKSGAMPPAGGPLSAGDQEAVRVWLACGARDI